MVCLCAVGVFASATTITRPYGSSDYAGGTKAVGTKVNAEFASIVAWLNGANISSDNIATSGVATANIASFAVTTAKLNTASVTPVKLSTANLQISSSSSLYTLSNTETPATVTNLSTTITTTADRPVSIRLENNPSTYQSSGVAQYTGYIKANGAGSDTLGASLFFVRDSSTTAHWQVLSNGVETVPCSAFSYTENLPSGTYTYYVKASTGDASSTGIAVINCRLVVEEL